MSPGEVVDVGRANGYVGLWIEQGVPILDRDLNLIHDIILEQVRSIVTRYIGDGCSVANDGFAITMPADATANATDFVINAGEGGKPGSLLVNGIEVPIAATINYSD